MPRRFRPVLAVLLILAMSRAAADGPRFETIRLPALRIDGQAATAHTQGLEFTAGGWFVTARREEVRPRRALLLRVAPGAGADAGANAGTAWEAWDLTPLDSAGAPTAMDHPGGLQSDGKRLWIPLAESRRNGRSLIRSYPLAGLQPGRPARWDTEIAVDDHVGALAVSAAQNVILGATWDTARVLVWDLSGHPLRPLDRPDLRPRGLGVEAGGSDQPGVTVQDWKIIRGALYASGLVPAAVPPTPAAGPASRWLRFPHFLDRAEERQTVVLPRQGGTETAREAMAVADGMVYFLPDDLGATNRLYRTSLKGLLQASTRNRQSSSHDGERGR